MEPPEIQYATTTDGYSIAYTSWGDGPPTVWIPHLFNHVVQMWELPRWRGVWEIWGRGLGIISYDARGQGLSSRGLPEQVTFADYERDLEAVLQRLGLQRVVLFATGSLCPIAISFAAHYPQLVAGLVFWNYLDYHSGRDYR